MVNINYMIEYESDNVNHVLFLLVLPFDLIYKKNRLTEWSRV